MPNDLIDGFNLGAGIVDRFAGYKQQAYANEEGARRFDTEEARLERAHSDANALAKANLDIEARRSDILNQKTKADTEIQARILQLDQQRRDRRVNDMKRLVELDQGTSDLTHGVVADDFLQKSLDLWRNNLDLLQSDDPFIQSQATALKQKSETAYQQSAGYKHIQELSRAAGSGFYQPPQGSTTATGQLGPGQEDVQKSAILQQDLSDIRTLGQNYGVDLQSPKYADVMKGLSYNSATGGLSDESKAKLKRVVEVEARRQQMANPDTKSRVKLGFGKPDAVTGKYPGEADYSLEDLLYNPQAQAQAKAILQQQGVSPEEADKFTGTTADEAGHPRVEQGGALFRWSQSSGKYILVKPPANLSQP